MLAGAVLMRLNYLFHAPDRAWPHSVWFEGDGPLYARWAGALAEGEAFEYGLAVHAPAVGYIVRWLGYGVVPEGASPDFTRAKVVWCIASALACAATYLAARMELRRRASAIAAALLAFWYPSFVIATSLNGEALYSLLVPLLAAGTLWVARRPGVRGLGGPTLRGGFLALVVAAVTGLLHGAAMLIRPEHSLLVGMLLAFIAWGRRRELASIAGAARVAALLVVTAAGAVGACLPWSDSTYRATERFNTRFQVGQREVRYGRMFPPWTPEARAEMDRLPVFAREANAMYASVWATRRGVERLTPEHLREFFAGEFGYTPEPLRRWSLVSGQGPLTFALANHPGATGGFSTAALDARFDPDPVLSFAHPSHLRLYNRGYEVGLGWIREDPGRWAALVGRKLAIFAQGATQGVTSANWPLGREGIRRAVDSFVAESPVWPWWAGGLGAAMLAGVLVCVRRGVGTVWLLVILSKVVVTVLFFGYARQAASVLPVFAVLVGVGVDAAVGAVEH
ncbi:MAG: PCP reductase family protein, partial [Phycisphaerales bacterium]